MGRFKRKKKVLGKCKYCDDDAFYQFKNEVLCCQQYTAKCPAIRKKNQEKNSKKTHPNYGKDKYAEEKAKKPPFCGCRCGDQVTWNKTKKYWNRFIKGHGVRGKDKWAKKKLEGASICKCGKCGRKTNWSPMTKQYNDYIKGHNYPTQSLKNRKAQSERQLALGDEHYFRKEEFIAKISGDGNVMKRPEIREKVSKALKNRKCPWISERMKNGGAVHAQSFITNPSKPQVELFELVKSLYPQTILNYPSLNKSIDIAIPDLMIAIEYDGSYWHKDREESDKIRQNKLENIGWKFLRYVDYVPIIDELKKDLLKINDKI